MGLGIIDIQTIARTLHIVVATVVEYDTIKRLAFRTQYQMKALAGEIIGIDAIMSIYIYVFLLIQCHQARIIRAVELLSLACAHIEKEQAIVSDHKEHQILSYAHHRGHRLHTCSHISQRNRAEHILVLIEQEESSLIATKPLVAILIHKDFADVGITKEEGIGVLLYLMYLA